MFLILASLAMILGLLFAGLLLFPWRLHIQAHWHNFDTAQLEVRFARWTLWQSSNPSSAPPQETTPSAPQHIERSDIFETPSSAPTPKPIPSPVLANPQPSVELPSDIEESPPSKRWSHLILRLKRSVVHTELWIGWIQWIFSLAKPSFGLLNLQITKLHLQHDHRDPFFCSQVQSAWYTLEPIFNSHGADLKLLPLWQGKETLIGEIQLCIEHRLWKWIPWLALFLWRYPWAKSYRSWKKSGLNSEQRSLNFLEKKLYQALKVNT